MSIQLVLSHYLAGLRERNELDVLLPELLKAMGHNVLSRPQVGPGQAGVDVLSTKTGQMVLMRFMFTSSNLATSDGLIFTVGLSLLIPLSVRPAMTSSEIVYRNHSNRCASGSFWYPMASCFRKLRPVLQRRRQTSQHARFAV